MSDGATYGALGYVPVPTETGVRERVLDFLQRRVTRSRDAVSDIPVIPEPWPDLLDPADLPWSARTFNAIARGRLLGRLPEVETITYRDLFEVRQLGAATILDFACVLEAAIDFVNTLSSDAAAEVAMHGSYLEPDDGLTDGAEVEAASEALLHLVDHPWVGMVSREDPRFRDVLPNDLQSATLLEAIEDLFDLSPLSAARYHALMEAATDLQARVEEIERLTLDEAIEDYFHQLTNWDLTRLRAFYRRFGWGAEFGQTLEQIGSSLGVSRERARQLEKRLVEGGPGHPAYVPALDQALQVLSEITPCAAAYAAEELRRRGISRHAFRPEGVMKAAEILGHHHHFSIVEERGEVIVTSASGRAHVSQVRQTADRQVSASGASTVLEVREELATQELELQPEEVRGVLEALPHLRFVGPDWFIRTDRHTNRVTTVGQKVLAVAYPLPVPLIREGVRREMRFRKTRGQGGWPLVLPPAAAVREILERDPTFEVDSEGLVHPVKPLDYRKILAPSERVLVDVMRSSPNGILDRASLLEEAARRGANMNTTSVMLTYSSIIQHLGVDLWALRSMTVDPAAVEAVRQANALRPRSKRTLGYTWTPTGRLAIAYRTPQRTQSPVFLVPAGVSRFVSGRDFVARTESGVPAGTLRVYENGMCAGYGSFLKAAGAEENDVLVVEFSITGGTAVLRLESDEIFDNVEFAD